MSLTFSKTDILEYNNTSIFDPVKGTELYAFTVKVLKKPKEADEKTYEIFFKILFALSDVLTYCGELDPKGVLHYHGVIRIKRNFYRKNLIVKGFNIHLSSIYNLYGWMEYCFKNNILHCFENMKKKKT